MALRQVTTLERETEEGEEDGRIAEIAQRQASGTSECPEIHSVREERNQACNPS